MKITKIRFENIHSLKGEHKIDFGEGILAEAGLFAITGPTGSGKSTLLDVITLAIFNRIARVNKDVTTSVLEEDGGIMTRNMKSCFAEVEYRVNGKYYRTHWSIERNRNNNLNPRKQELVEVATGNILESSTKTPIKNAEIIGLSYEQFVQAMVLSQGEFSKLLQAPRNERNKLLEDITGARSYRQIGQRVFQRYRTVDKKLELKEAGLENIQLLSPEVITERKAELKAFTEAKPKVEKAYEIASEKIKTRKDLQIKETERKQLENEKLKLKENFEVFNPYNIQLKQHDKLSKYGVKLREFDVTLKELNALNEQSNQLQKSISETESQQKSHLQSISTLIKENIDIKSANEKLDAFRNKIIELQAEEKKKQGEALLYQQQLNTYVRNINLLGYRLAEAEKPKVFEIQFDTFEKSIQENIDNSGMKSMEELNAGLKALRDKYEKAGDLLTKKEQAIKLHTILKNQKTKLKTSEETLATDSKRKESLDKEIPNLKTEVEGLEKTIEHQRTHQSLEVHRQQLESEQPCPLCGSLEHPYASEEHYFDIKEELLKGKKESLKEKSEHIITLNAKNEFQKKEIAELQSEIKITTEDEIQNLNLLIEYGKQLDWNHEESLDTLQAQRTELAANIQKLEKDKHAFQAHSILKDLSASFKEWRNSLKSYISLKDERTTLYEADDINEKSNILAANITQSITNILSLKKQLQDNEEKLKSSNLDKTNKEEELNNIVLNEQLECLETLRAAILPEEKASRIREQGSKLKEQNTRISEKDNLIEKVLKELRDKDDQKLSSETLQLQFEETKAQNDLVSQNIGKITEVLKKNEETRQRQQKVLEEINLIKKDLSLWKTMNDLIGDSTGNKFSNFVQDLTLEQLIGYANTRLEQFSDRYLLDIPTAKESDKSDTLKIFDKYMGNARRSVRTLSGGETFLVSLAMAFALSDIAARNVKIESLFIDEGFGTLDPETLDQAITILEKMQNEGEKSVGIISHVGALKERITTQIQLDKSSLGYSTIDIVQ